MKNLRFFSFPILLFLLITLPVSYPVVAIFSRKNARKRYLRQFPDLAKEDEK